MIPIDSLENSYQAIENGLRLCEPLITKIHLVYMYRDDKVPWYLRLNANAQKRFSKKEDITQKPSEIALLAEKQKATCKVLCSAIEIDRPVNEVLAKYILANNIDILVTAAKGCFQTFIKKNINAHHITGTTNCSVLFVSDRDCSHPTMPVRSIFFSVGTNVPENKIDMAIILAKAWNAQIHLAVNIKFGSRQNKKVYEAFYITYKKLLESGIHINYKLIEGYMSSYAVYKYAKDINADIALVESQKETRLFYLLMRHLGKRKSVDPALLILLIKADISKTKSTQTSSR